MSAKNQRSAGPGLALRRNPSHPVTGFVACARSGNQTSDFPQTERGHIAVNGFIAAFAYAVCLVENPDSLAFVRLAIKRCPRRPMALVPIAGIGFQRTKIAPVLEENQTARATEHAFATQKTTVWPGREFGNHRLHGSGDGQPFVYTVEFVDPHADEENGQWLGVVCGKTAE